LMGGEGFKWSGSSDGPFGLVVCCDNPP
jgi:hypothetical protein